MQFPLEKAKRVVIKLGTGILTEGIGLLDTARIAGICEQVAALKQAGCEVIIVSSGAVGLGMGKLGLKKKPIKLSALQMCAAIGQSRLIQTWQKLFDPFNITVGQLLITREDVESRERHVAAKDLLEELLAEGIVPIVNENDSISVAEIKFGDNDVLSSLVSVMTKADLLLILSTAPGLIDTKGTGKIIPVVEKITAEIEGLAEGTTSTTATGGMITKIQAAKIGTQSGCTVFIGSGKETGIVGQFFKGEAEGTVFIPSASKLQSRKRWLTFFHRPAGSVTIDAGAVDALRSHGRSLLAKGITAVEGNFHQGDVIKILGADQACIAQGICEYNSDALQKILGLSSSKIQELFPEKKHLEVVHRDSLVMLEGEDT